MKVSFDFDDTLSFENIQEYAKSLIDRGIEVWIVTTRWNRMSMFYSKDYYNLHGNTWSEVHKVALELGIPISRVIFTNYQYKSTFFKDHTDFIWHLDDNPYEFKAIEKLGIKAIDSLNSNFEERCNKLLEDGKVFQNGTERIS